MDTESLANLIKHAPIFAQTIGLIATWVGMRKATQHNKAQDFLIWLQENNQQELKETLERDKQAVDSIQTLLNENQEVLLAKLKGIDELLAQIASRIEGLGAIAHAVRPGVELSEQAISILRQLDQRGATGFTKMKNTPEGPLYIYIDAGGNIKYSDRRFVEDDLNTLVRLGLLRHDCSPKGYHRFGFTRAGSALVKAIDTGHSGA